MKFIHVADLHLSETEADYGFHVLTEILGRCGELSVDALLLSGDIFDSYDALKALFPRFRKALEDAEGSFPVLAIAGNHDLPRGSGDLGRFDFGQRLRLAHQAPQRLLLGQGPEACQFLLFPYGSPIVPLPAAAQDHALATGSPAWTVVLAHGALPELNWLGPEAEGDEARRSSLDSHALRALTPNYVALGHIHEGQSTSIEGCLFAYPGSARVWRRGELGPRRALLVEMQAGRSPRCEPLSLALAGQYRSLRLELDEEGRLPAHAQDTAAEGLGGQDWLSLSISGVAQRESSVKQEAETLRRGLEGRCRKLDIDWEDVFFLGDGGESEAVRAFRRAWVELLPSLEERYGREASLRALRLGLSAISRVQEASS